MSIQFQYYDTVSHGYTGILTVTGGVLVTDGSGVPSFSATLPAITTANLTDSALTAGSVVYAGTAGLLSQDNAQFFWDHANKRLGIGTATPGYSVHVVGADGIIGLIAGATKGIRFDTSSTTSTINGVDNTGTGSFQPLVIAADTLTFTPASVVSVSNCVFDGSGFAGAGINVKLRGDGATTPSKFLRVTAGKLQVVNNAYSIVIFNLDDAGTLSIAGPMIQAVYTVGTLPAASAALKGARASVNDALAIGAFGAVATAGGTTLMPVYCDGTNWRYG